MYGDINRDLFTWVLAGGKGDRLQPLTKYRAKPAVPFGGIYRLIDFPLSSCVNSKLLNVEVLTQYKSTSLKRHVDNGWGDVTNPKLGSSLTTEPAQQRGGVNDWFKGTADAVRQNFYKLEERDDSPKYVLLLSGDHVYKMDYRLMLEDHIKKNAKMTISVIEQPIEAARRKLGILEVDADDRVIGFNEKPEDPKPMPGNSNVALSNMGIYLFDMDFLSEIIKMEGDDFGKDIIPKILGERINSYDFSLKNIIYDTFFKFKDGERLEVVEKIPDAAYWRDVGTVDAYYRAQMDLVGVSPEFNLYGKKWPIQTYMEPNPPSKSIMGGFSEDSLVSDGCIISGGRVKRSVLSPGVIVDEGAEVEDSVIMHKVQIGPGAKINRCIIDKECIIHGGTELNPGIDIDSYDAKHTKHEHRADVQEVDGILVVPRMTEMRK